LDFRISMNFIVISPEGCPWSANLNLRPRFYDERQTLKSTSTKRISSRIRPTPNLL
jgi:hypothetical protein